MTLARIIYRSLRQHALSTLIAALTTASVAVSLRAEDKPAAAIDLSFADLKFVTQPPKQIEIEGAKAPMTSFIDQVPEKIRNLNGKRVSLGGYMMPTRLEGKDVRECIIVISPLVCCYGQTPDINEFVIVRMVGKPASLIENTPLKFEGIFKVSDIYENGYWTGLYAMDCSDVKS